MMQSDVSRGHGSVVSKLLIFHVIQFLAVSECLPPIFVSVVISRNHA